MTTIDCPHCTRGTQIDPNGRRLRCCACQGTGRLRVDHDTSSPQADTGHSHSSPACECLFSPNAAATDPPAAAAGGHIAARAA